MSERVRVYWDSTRNVWSVKSGTKVVHKTNRLILRHVAFRVSERGRQRVLREGRKNVHAYCEGIVVKYTPKVYRAHAVRYNPYERGEFFYEETKQGVFSAGWALLEDGRAYILEELFGTEMPVEADSPL